MNAGKERGREGRKDNHKRNGAVQVDSELEYQGIATLIMIESTYARLKIKS